MARIVLDAKQQKAYDRLLSAGVFYHKSDEELEGGHEDEAERDEWRFMLNLNDAMYWGCADCEPIPPNELEAVWRLFYRYGDCGIMYWVLKARGQTWLQVEFKDVRRKVQFVEREESLRAKYKSSSAYAYSEAEYTIYSDNPEPAPQEDNEHE